MTTHTKQSRETLYKGIRFRSMLETRVAMCLDFLQVPWRYEPFMVASPHGFYLPDFLVDDAVFLEVKPCAWLPDPRWYWAAMEIRSRTPYHRFAPGSNFSFLQVSPPDGGYSVDVHASVRGVATPLLWWYCGATNTDLSCPHSVARCQCAEVFHGIGGRQGDPVLMQCDRCSRWYGCLRDGSWACPRCGAYDGSGHLRNVVDNATLWGM